MSSARFDVGQDPRLLIDGRELPILVRRYARARGYRLRYDAVEGLLRLSVPARGSLRPALDWVRTQEGWIARQIARAPAQIRLAPGVLVPVEGLEREIVWDGGRARMPVLEDDRLLLGGPEESVGPRLLRWLCRRALDTLRQETLEIAARESLAVASVAIGDPRGRWGSCASSGAIRYNWRLILAPPPVRLATVAHEVAHLLHMDHSRAFHAAHKRLLGADPRAAHSWLRAHGSALHRFTA